MACKAFSILALALLVLLLTPGVVAEKLFEYSEVKTATLYAPAVTSDGRGVLSKVVVGIAYPGSGRVFFSALPYTEVETQGAARLAAYIASIIAGVDFYKYDYFVIVESDTVIIGGPSAGGLMAVGFAALLLNQSLSTEVTMTGMINPDGTIGPVGGLKEKLEAAASAGFKVFLIPRGQRYYRYPVYTEIRRGILIIRQVTYQTIDLYEYGRSLNVSVYEVGDVVEALSYFTGYKQSFQDSFKYPSELSEVFNRFFNDLVARVRSTISLAANLINARRYDYVSYYYSRVIKSINETLDYYVHLHSTYSYYSVFKVLDLFEQAVAVYYVLAGASSALEELGKVLNTTTASTVQECTLENSLALAQLSLAWYYYVAAENATDAQDVIAYLSKATRLVEEYKLYALLSNYSKTLVECSSTKYTRAYAYAMGAYAYVERLLEEAGTSTPTLREAGSYTAVLSNAYSSSDVSMYGASVYTIAYTASSIHEAFGTKNALNYTRLASLYAKVLSTPLVLLLERAILEASSSNDADAALLLLELQVSLVQIAALVGAEVSLLQESSATTGSGIGGQIGTTGSTTTSPSSSLTTPGTTQKSGQYTTQHTMYLTIAAVLAVVVAASLVYIILKKRISKAPEEPPLTVPHQALILLCF